MFTIQGAKSSVVAALVVSGLGLFAALCSGPVHGQAMGVTQGVPGATGPQGIQGPPLDGGCVNGGTCQLTRLDMLDGGVVYTDGGLSITTVYNESGPLTRGGLRQAIEIISGVPRIAMVSTGAANAGQARGATYWVYPDGGLAFIVGVPSQQVSGHTRYSINNGTSDIANFVTPADAGFTGPGRVYLAGATQVPDVTNDGDVNVFGYYGPGMVHRNRSGGNVAVPADNSDFEQWQAKDGTVLSGVTDAGAFYMPSLTVNGAQALTSGTGANTATGVWTSSCATCVLGNDFQSGLWISGAVAKFGEVSCEATTAGSGGTNGVVVRIRNFTDSSTLCTCTLGACNSVAAAKHCTCGQVPTANKMYEMQLDPTGSGTDCVVNPANLTCNVELIH